jgi:hypothetical protein
MTRRVRVVGTADVTFSAAATAPASDEETVVSAVVEDGCSTVRVFGATTTSVLVPSNRALALEVGEIETCMACETENAIKVN